MRVVGIQTGPYDSLTQPCKALGTKGWSQGWRNDCRSWSDTDLVLTNPAGACQTRVHKTSVSLTGLGRRREVELQVLREIQQTCVIGRTSTVFGIGRSVRQHVGITGVVGEVLEVDVQQHQVPQAVAPATSNRLLTPRYSPGCHQR